MKVAIIGATGAVGREMVEDLAASSLADIELLAIASPRSEGQSLSFRDRRVTVKAYTAAALADCPYVLMSAGSAFSLAQAQALAQAGAVVIDNSSAWRRQADIPLVVPEVNGDDVKGMRQGIIANPNCSTIQMVVALAPLEKRWGLRQVQVATYQSVSGSGQKGIAELSQQVQARLKFEDVEPQVYAQPIAFNVLPLIGTCDEAGHCEEELKMVYETRRLLKRPDLDVLATTVRVPVFNCHSEAISVELAEEVSCDDVLAVWGDAKGLQVYSDHDGADLPTPFHMVGQEHVAVCRLRLPYGKTRSKWLQFWNVADNLKKGAATNAVQILELLVKGR